MPDQTDRVSRNKPTDRTAGLGQHDDGSIGPQNEPRRVEVRRLLVHVSADCRHGLSGVEAVKYGVREFVPIHRPTSVLFRVDGKRHKLGPDLFELIDVLLEISQLLIAESSPVSAVEEHDTPASCEISGDRHLATPNLGSDDGCEDLVVLEAHIVHLRLTGCPPRGRRPRSRALSSRS